MRCCIQNCFNYEAKKTNKSHGVTFHRTPKDPDLSAAWISAVARLGCKTHKCLVVCSEHFLPENFDNTHLHLRRLKSGALPTIVCRVCLVSNVKMYDLTDSRLSEMFQNITGISVIDNKGSILQRVCWECAARLTAAAAFRDKALLGDALLKDQAHIKESDIALLKQNYSYLKSPLAVQTVFTSSDIGFEHTISENTETDNMFLQNDETVTKEKTNTIKINENKIKLEEHEPLIDVPVKTELEYDPIAVNMRFQDRKSDTPLEQTHFNDTSPREDSEDEMTNTEELINNNDNIIREDKQNKATIINDGNIILEEDNDSLEKNQKLDGIDKIVNESSSEENTSAGGVLDNKNKQEMTSKVVTTKEKVTIRNNEGMKEKIIAMKNEGFTVPAIAKEIGTPVACIYSWLHRRKREFIANRRSVTPGREQTVPENDSEQSNCNNPETGKEMGVCSAIVRQRLRQAGLERILMRKSDRTEDIGRKISKHKEHHDDLKERIIALKQEGMSHRRVAYLLATSRGTIRKWWNCWCKDGQMNNRKSRKKKDRKTTPEEDKLLIDRVAQEQTVHTASLAKEYGISTTSVRRRLREAGFDFKERKAKVPLRSGRRHKIDEATKQKIISMKHNGVSVTDIANQFRVTRSSVYIWWRRWCKENNIKVTSDNNTSTTSDQEQSLAEDTNVEQIVQTAPILSARKSLWQKLPDVEFVMS